MGRVRLPAAFRKVTPRSGLGRLGAALLVTFCLGGLAVLALPASSLRPPPPTFHVAGAWGEKVYILSDHDRFLRALDLEKGQVVGKLRLKGSPSVVHISQAAFGWGQGFVHAGGFLHSFDAEKGRLLWVSKAPGSALKPPQIAGGQVITCSTLGVGGVGEPNTVHELRAFDAKTGELRWSRRGVYVLGSCASTLVAVDSIGPIFQHGLSSETGGDSWKTQWVTDTFARDWELMQVPASDAAIAIHKRIVTCFDPASGRVLWRRHIEADKEGHVEAVTDGTTVYLVEFLRAPISVAIYRLGAEDGKLDLLHRVSASRKGAGYGSCIMSGDEDELTDYPWRVCGISGNTLIVAGTGAAWALDLETGAAVWSKARGAELGLDFPAPWSNWLVAGKGRIVAAGSNEGRKTVVCLDGNTGEALWTYSE